MVVIEGLTQIECVAFELAQMNLADPGQTLSAMGLQGLILGMVKEKLNHAAIARADYEERTYSHEPHEPGCGAI